jgi:hypothetical protein
MRAQRTGVCKWGEDMKARWGRYPEQTAVVAVAVVAVAALAEADETKKAQRGSPT